jgi:hypothetical protein
MNSDFPFFQFEADFVESLCCIPMQVRLKLDTCLELLPRLKFSQTGHDLSSASRDHTPTIASCI